MFQIEEVRCHQAFSFDEDVAALREKIAGLQVSHVFVRRLGNLDSVGVES